MWLQTTNPATAAAGLEAGLDTLVFGGADPAGAAAAWGSLAAFTAILVGEARPGDGARSLSDAATGAALGWQHPLPDAAAAAALAARIAAKVRALDDLGAALDAERAALDRARDAAYAERRALEGRRVGG